MKIRESEPIEGRNVFVKTSNTEGYVPLQSKSYVDLFEGNPNDPIVVSARKGMKESIQNHRIAQGMGLKARHNRGSSRYSFRSFIRYEL